jgi:serine/threonine-protein kinase
LAKSGTTAFKVDEAIIMNSERLDEEAIFQLARQIDNPQVRAAYLQQVRNNDTALLARVEALLEVHRHDQEFLKSNAAQPAVTTAPASLNEHASSTIGPYRLMEQIGEGGMGVVFVAEQQRPLRRKVALKIIKPGMDTKEVIARFEAERQALARRASHGRSWGKPQRYLLVLNHAVATGQVASRACLTSAN